MSPSTGSTSNVFVDGYGYVGSQQAIQQFPYETGSTNMELLQDSTNWVQLGEHSISGNVATYAPVSYKVEGTETGQTYYGSFIMDIAWPKMYFTAREDDIVGTAGTLSAWALIQ